MPPDIFGNTPDVGMGEESDRPKRRAPVSSKKRLWFPEELALLGKVTDRQAAERLNRSVCSVTSQRCALGIPCLPGKGLWTSHEIEQMGRLPDKEAARVLGRSVRAVARKREALGRRAPGPSQAHWREVELQLLGKVTDEDAARLTNRSLFAVCQKRSSLGIQKFDPRVHAWKEKKVGQKINRESLDWGKEEDALLGTMPDRRLANNLGRSVKAVKARRQQKRIWLCLKPWRPEDEKVLGSRPDSQIAKLLGRTIFNVAHRRRKLGIPCFHEHRPWHEHELEMLGLKTDQEVAQITGHPIKAVRFKRQELGREKADKVLNYWSLEADKLLGTMPDAELARRLGRSKVAVRTRRFRLKIRLARCL